MYKLLAGYNFLYGHQSVRIYDDNDYVFVDSLYQKSPLSVWPVYTVQNVHSLEIYHVQLQILFMSMSSTTPI